MKKMNRSVTWLFSVVGLGLSVAACGDDGDDTPIDGEFVLPADPFNVRRCPEVGTVPAMQMEAGFTNEANQPYYVGAYKFEASYGRDVIGNEDVDQTLVGRVMRMRNFVPGGGTGIAGETVHFFMEIDGTWTDVGQEVTDNKGHYTFAIPAEHAVGVGSSRVLAIVEATGTCIEHGVFLWPEGTKSTISDIDGTLTSTDAEFMTQISGKPEYVPLQNVNSDLLMQTWAQKGYASIYLTARPNDFRWLSRVWLREQGFPFGPMETAESFVFGSTAREYKGRFVNQLNALGIDLVAAYGNAESDVQAYDDGSIPKALTFTINEAEGKDGTVGVSNGDWTSHISEFVQPQPTVDNGF